MYPERLEDLSIHYWLINNFPSFVTIVDGFPKDDLVIPSVAVEWQTIDTKDLELGNRKPRKIRDWYIDIFATNKSQRDEFAYKILNDLDNGVPVYNYNEGFPEQGITPTRLGSLTPVHRVVKNIPVDPDLVDELYYRAVVIFTAEYDQF